ncbi:MAG: GNAT family N-acetyltransferase [Candidatus Bathyarchaeia archaeon]|jgi:GNAT superfamily N-acetyltransferase
MNILLRKVKPEDREKILLVELKSTPDLRYLPYVFDMFVDDRVGEFSVEEFDGELVACGKYTIVPDGSAWLETLRVIPERQGLGLGKHLYEHWLELASVQGVKAMRMYTGITNVVSSSLAERYGLTLQGTFKGATLPVHADTREKGGFVPVPDPREATELLMPLADEWMGWLVMNRTFYKLTPDLCEDMAKRGMVYRDSETRSIVTLGARFMPKSTLHIGVWDGDAEDCLRFANWKAEERGIPQLSCFYEVTTTKIGKELARHGFKFDASDYIVKGIYLN